MLGKAAGEAITGAFTLTQEAIAGQQITLPQKQPALTAMTMTAMANAIMTTAYAHTET
jgi:hypothetical protein